MFRRDFRWFQGQRSGHFYLQKGALYIMGRHGENIRKRKDGRWEARIISDYNSEGKAKYRSFYGKTYLEVKEKRNRYLSDKTGCQQSRSTLYHDNNIRDNTVKVEQIMREWLYSKKDYVKESTFARYVNLLEKHILPELGDIRLAFLTPERVNTFLKEKLYCGRLDGKGGLSPKTVSDIRSILILGLEYARQNHYSCSVDSKVFSPKLHKNIIKVLTQEEQRQLENFIYQHPDPIRLGILTALYSGIRIGELCALQWGDIYFDSRIIQISKTMIRIQNMDDNSEKKTRILISRPKTESSNRMVPLPSFIADFLIRFRQDPEDYLITGTEKYMEPRTCLCKYKKILKEAGLELFTFHTLRHTFATRCIESGFDAKSLSEILGHAEINTTLRNYVHPSIELKKKQMERLKVISVWGQGNGQNEMEAVGISCESEKLSYSILL